MNGAFFPHEFTRTTLHVCISHNRPPPRTHLRIYPMSFRVNFCSSVFPFSLFCRYSSWLGRKEITTHKLYFFIHDLQHRRACVWLLVRSSCLRALESKTWTRHPLAKNIFLRYISSQCITFLDESTLCRRHQSVSSPFHSHANCRAC